MRVFLDECVDWRLSRYIVGHEVRTAREMGWTSIRNGEQLALAAREFDTFVTVDRNLSFQQNVGALPMTVIILRAKTNRLTDLRPLIPQLLTEVESPRDGLLTIGSGPAYKAGRRPGSQRGSMRDC